MFFDCPAYEYFAVISVPPSLPTPLTRLYNDARYSWMSVNLNVVLLYPSFIRLSRQLLFDVIFGNLQIRNLGEVLVVNHLV